MMRLLALFALLFCMLGASPAFADPPTANGVRLETIKDLHYKGYLTDEQAAKEEGLVLQKADENLQEASDSSWTRWFSWTNLVKTAAILAFLICFWGIISKLIKACWSLIASVPVWLYQVVLFGVTTLGLVSPATFWASQSFYIALFCAFAAPMVAGWTIATYPKLAEAVLKLFSLGIPEGILASFYGMLYFGVLAICYSSQIFGFFAVISFSALFGFGMYYMPWFGALVLEVRKGMAGLVIGSHALAIMVYIALKHAGVPYIGLFTPGFEYWCSLALGVALLIDVSPWTMASAAGWKVLRFIAVVILANFAYGYFGEHAIGAVIDVFAVLVVLDFLLYASWSTGMIIGTGVTGLLLYFSALVMEHQGKAILALFS